jgi:hypothetical protein
VVQIAAKLVLEPIFEADLDQAPIGIPRNGAELTWSKKSIRFSAAPDPEI